MFCFNNRLRRRIAAIALAFTVTSGVLVATPTVASAQAVTNISQGDTGAVIADIQRSLNRHGIPVAVDSDYGPATRSAVRNLQQRYGLQIDGVVGPATAAALEGPIQYLREGSTGLAVTRLQERLKAHLNTNLTIDGDFGSSTASAVRTLQRRFDLAADSIAGPDVYNIAYSSVTRSTGPTFDDLVSPDPASRSNPHQIPLSELPEPGRSTMAVQLTQELPLATFTNMHPLGGPSVDFYGWEDAQPPTDLPNLDFADWLGPQDYCTGSPDFTLSGTTDFRPACLRHDFCIDNLDVAGLKGDRGWRVRCDDQFTEDLDRLCDISNAAFVSRNSCRLVATEYELTVRAWTELATLFT